MRFFHNNVYKIIKLKKDMIGFAVITLLLMLMIISIVYTFSFFPLTIFLKNFVATNFNNNKLLEYYDVVSVAGVVTAILFIIGIFIWVIAYIVKKEKYEWLYVR